MKKTFFVFLSIMVFVLYCFSACTYCSSNGTGNFDKNMKRIAFISPQTNYPVWLQARTGFMDAAEQYGFYGEWLGGGNCNIDDMIREINTCTYEKVDAIITCPLTPSKFTEVFEKLKEKDIPLITIAVDSETEDLRTAYIGSNYEEMGKLQAQALHDKVGDDMKIGVIMSGLTTQNQVIQVNMLKEYIKDFPGSEIIDYAEDWADPVIGMNVFSQMLSNHPEMNAVFVTSGGAISSYGKIIEERHLQDKISLIGMDIIQDNIDVVKDGSVYGVMSQDFYSMGFLGGEYAYKASCGEEIPSITYTESILVTLQNVASIQVVDISDES